MPFRRVSHITEGDAGTRSSIQSYAIVTTKVIYFKSLNRHLREPSLFVIFYIPFWHGYCAKVLGMRTLSYLQIYGIMLEIVNIITY